ncbi:hypothetical protein [Streptomyces sp. NPDC051662]|uniref:hypothetical protein n=1 Tax=Streptomyces sp. NPDC051662 TaxID=3154750 RepID=UPI00341539EF
MLVTLSGINPAAAASKDFHVTYKSGSNYAQNYYDVDIKGTVTRTGDRYELKGTVTARCVRKQGPDQLWSLAFGSSAESWRYTRGPCTDRPTTTAIRETGRLRPDGRVYVQAGAYGGEALGAWGWGTQRSVWV